MAAPLLVDDAGDMDDAGAPRCAVDDAGDMDGTCALPAPCIACSAGPVEITMLLGGVPHHMCAQCGMRALALTRVFTPLRRPEACLTCRRVTPVINAHTLGGPLCLRCATGFLSLSLRLLREVGPCLHELVARPPAEP